jgi:ornithine cyclodeaminase
MLILDLDGIRAALADIDPLPAIEEGFVAYSEGKTIVPPVGELAMETGEVHIKYGCIKDQPHYVIKVASGFHGNAAKGLPTGHGMMLVFSQETGFPVALLLDEAYLTDIRTAVAGAIGAKYLAPAEVGCIGIVGSGVQARLQLEYLKPLTACRDVLVHGIDGAGLERYQDDMADAGFTVGIAPDGAAIGAACNLIVTTTPATTPILLAEHIRPGTHITAIGSDTPEKQELDAAILAGADVVVADSIPQSRLRGEISQALGVGAIEESKVVELGNVIAGKSPGRTAEDQITVFDSTGVAVQDIQIAKAVIDQIEAERT